MFIPRIINLAEIIEKKSYFLFGPRQTGKSTLIREQLQGVPVYNLLDGPTLLRLSRSPTRLREEIRPEQKVAVIDEIQKLPSLLDEVHYLIEERNMRFLLTGSSARKLRQGGVNLLGGRARSQTLHPLLCSELGDQFDLLKALNHGLIPSLYFSDSPQEDLESYASNYLKEEIMAEGLTRNIPAFSRFLEVAALCNGKLINYTEIGNDAQVPRTTVHEYFQILKDTLIAYELPPWKKSKTRKPISTSKFYFFDGGVARFLQNRSLIQERSPEFGDAFETYFFHELKTFVDYTKCGELHYWRSTSGFEVDFILGDSTAIEIKAKSTISRQELKGLLALREEKKLKQYFLISREDHPRTVEGIQLLPWNLFLKKLWGREVI